jgi:hypothetical protein
MVARWNDDLAGLGLVAERDDGSLWWLDGQQRAQAGAEAGHDGMYVRVIRVRGTRAEARKREAILFHAANSGARQVTGRDKHRALVLGGDPTAVHLEEILHEYDLSCLYWGRDRRTIDAIAAVRRPIEYLADGEPVLRWALEAGLPLLDRHKASDVFRSNIVGALTTLAEQYADTVTSAEMASVLRGQTADQLNAVCGNTGNGSGFRYYAENLRQHLNVLTLTPLLPDLDY